MKKGILRLATMAIFVTIFLGACGQQETAEPVAPEIESTADNPELWLASCGEFPELCVPLCQRSAESCATRLNDYLTTKVGGLYRYQNWPLFPTTEPFHPNRTTPMHGSYLTLYVNDIANEYLSKIVAKGTNGTLETVDFPNGSLVVKQNYASKDGDPEQKDPWLTVMWKLDGYCHAGFGGAGPCSGGEWFYYLSRFGGFHDFNGTPAWGKAEAFCTDCHGPVQKADYLWTLYEQLKSLQASTSTVPSEQAATTNVSMFCADTPLNPVVPGDVALNPLDVIKNQGGAQAQLMFDCFSWRSFVALNWPAEAGQRGVPDRNKTIGDPGSPRVWETYREVFEVFQPADPNWSLDSVDWNSQESLDPVCNASSENKVLRMTDKLRSSPILNETHQAFGNQFNILVDQNGNQLHYEVLVNRDEFEFFKENHYANTGNYDVGGPLSQSNWQSPPLHFPDNIRGTEGAIEIKAAWRIMCTEDDCTVKDDPARYYTREVQLYSPQESGGGDCQSASVGLVGMHIGHKTFWTPQWVWSTFEHLDNVPPADGPGVPGVKYALYSDTSAEAGNQPSGADACSLQRPGALPTAEDPRVINCPNNQLICNSHPDADGQSQVKGCQKQNDLSRQQNPHADSLIPNQVIRLDPISKSPLNVSYPTALLNAGSPLANYRLVNTQWPVRGRGTPIETTINMKLCGEPKSNPATEPCYTLAPAGLALRNSTMETFQTTYIDETDHPSGQTSSAGCMQCHGVAGLDFSFAWTDAAEEVVVVVQDNLNDPPAGSYRNSCRNISMQGGTLDASCSSNQGTASSTSLAKAHLCSGDIANINGKLLCNPPLGSFSLSCTSIDIQGTTLSASCETNQGDKVPSSLNVAGYTGIIENCNGVLTKERCG